MYITQKTLGYESLSSYSISNTHSKVRAREATACPFTLQKLQLCKPLCNVPF